MPEQYSADDMEKTVIPHQQLNPFALPSETEVRFTLLLLSAVMLSFSLGNVLTVWLSDVTGWQPLGDIWEYALDLNTFNMAEAAAIYVRRLFASIPWLLLPPGLSLLVVGIAWVIYRRHPQRIRRRKHLQPVPPEKDPVLRAAVDELSALSGVAPPPAIETAGGTQASDGQAFGFRGRYVLRLGNRLRVLLRKRRDIFRAIVLHELAHITNKDIFRTYFAQALWVGTAVLVILILVIIALVFSWGTVRDLFALGLGGMDWGDLIFSRFSTFLGVVFQVIITFAVVAVMRSGMLRVREIYADWRAALLGSKEALKGILQGVQQQEEKVGRIRGLMRLHPPASQRLEALQQPLQLFKLQLDVPFFAGILMALILEGVFSFVLAWSLPFGRAIEMVMYGILMPLIERGTTGMLLLGLVIVMIATPLVLVFILSVFLVPAYFVSNTIGVEIQREAVAALTQKKQGCAPYLRMLLPALLMASGLQVGLIISPLGMLAPLWNPRSWIILVVMPLWLLVVTGYIWLWLVYIRFFSVRVLGRHARKTPPRRSRRMLSLTSGLLLWAICLPVLVAQVMIMEFSLASGSPTLPLESLPIAAAAALGIYALVFVLTGLGVGFVRLVRRSRCATCDAPVQAVYTIGHKCSQCGQPLSPWLLLPRA